MHHSSSSPQIYPGGFAENGGHSSSRYLFASSTMEAASESNVSSTPGAGRSGPSEVCRPAMTDVEYANNVLRR